MVKEIVDKIVIGNAFISTGRSFLTRNDIYYYFHIVDRLLPDGYYTSGNNNSLSDFCLEFPFIVKRNGDLVFLISNFIVMEKYFRNNLPKEIINVLDLAGFEFNKLKEIEQLGNNEDDFIEDGIIHDMVIDDIDFDAISNDVKVLSKIK